MFKAILKNLHRHAGNDELQTQRRFPRRKNDACICTVDGRAYPVENWSLGGMLVVGDARAFRIGKPSEIILKFRLDGKILDIPLEGAPVRKSNNKIAFQFQPLSKTAMEKFQTVIKGYSRS